MQTLQMLSPFRRHVERWRNCKRCRLHRTRASVVISRGTVPCDVLLVGEAPGDSEDALGQPFLGPAGHLLDSILDRVPWNGLTWAMTNLVCCRPIDESGEKSAPDLDEVEACAPRLQEFVNLCNPRLVVCVGKQARDALAQEYKHPVARFRKGTAVIDILHPAAILRMNAAQRGLSSQRCAVQIAAAVAKLEEGRL